MLHAGALPWIKFWWLLLEHEAAGHKRTALQYRMDEMPASVLNRNPAHWPESFRSGCRWCRRPQRRSTLRCSAALTSWGRAC